ncbi:hypothetical protein ABT364_26640 [Massilia sp. SR12]
MAIDVNEFAKHLRDHAVGGFGAGKCACWLPVLQRLATAMALTLQRAVGGSRALKQALARKRIDAAALSPELQDAFKPNLGGD